MPDDYSDYRPLLLEEASVETLKSDAYRQFILEAAITPAVRLVVRRSRLRDDWPYVDTKFNPNTGKDLRASSYNVIHTWFLGRGADALDGHLPWIDRLDDLSAAEKREAQELFARLTASMAEAINRVLDVNGGRCPFRVNRAFEAIDEAGKRIEADPERTGAGDLFVGKGLIAEGSQANVHRGVQVLLRSGEMIRQNRYDTDQFKDQPADIPQGPKMLMQAAPPLLYRKSQEPQLRQQIVTMTAEFMANVLDLHYDEKTAIFSEYVDRTSHQRKSYLDPGHANEFVGLGLGTVQCLKSDVAGLTDERRALVERACRELPRLLVKSTELGFNHKHPGLYKAVDTKTGKVLNDDMPWWNLPETMRAAVLAYEVAEDGKLGEQCLEMLRICHNAYFDHYLNRDNMLFAYQTISGATGKVADKVPAVPEGDPLYHTNLALLEMLDVLDRL